MPYLCRERQREAHHLYYLKNREAIKARTKKYSEDNKERLAPLRRIWSKKRLISNPAARQKRNEMTARWRREKSSPEKIAASRKRYRDAKFRNDPEYKVVHNCRSRIHVMIRLKKFKKASKSMELVGCSPSELRTYLESKWLPGMSWENYGIKGWHIDHKIPCASFDLTDPDQQKLCFHYTNLQPLWWRDNILKRDKILSQ